MSTGTVKQEVPKKSALRSAGFWAIIRYEILWNIRKKKVLGMVAIALAFSIISIALAPALANFVNQKITANPDYVVSSGGISSLVLFLFALVTVMNSVSSEFESGTIVPLLTKPVSRTTVFLGKVTAAILTLIPVYVLLYVIQIVGGIAIYGPQNNLFLVSVLFIGSLVSTLVWMSIVLALGSITKSSLFAALGPFLIYIGLFISSGIISAFLGQAWILTYVPGSGNSGYLVSSQTSSVPLGTTSISTGTDSIATTLANFILHPSYYVAFAKLAGLTSVASSNLTLTVTSTEPLSVVLLTAVGVALAYVFAFLFIGWFAFRKAQISE
jgi:ABC-type transport system involved in multi-copper enzyme maturation permease subunit